MKKYSIRLIGLLSFALTSVPCSAQLSRYECWFDNQQMGSSGALSGSELTVVRSFDTRPLSSGLHTFCFRAQQSDGKYSPVYTSTFLKFAAIDGSMLEYWIDDKFLYRDAIFVEGEDGVVQLSLDLNDSDKYPEGLHTFYFRVAEQGGNYSPIYTSSFMKFKAGEGQALEYWFDDGFNECEIKPIESIVDGVMPLELDMTNTRKFPLGFHQLHMRVVMSGSQYSPVYSSYVMRLPDGNRSELTFWVDDNYANRKPMAANASGNIVVLNGLLDLSSITPGIHQLHYRITSNGYDDGVTYNENIMVKSRYQQDDNTMIVAKRHWVDDADGGEMGVLKSVVFADSFTLNPWDYSEGQHAYHVAYQNSAGVWSETNTTYFYRDPMSPNQLKIGMLANDIDEVKIEGNLPVYNLNGMKVGMSSDIKQLHRGIYIIGGRKVVKQ